MTTRHSVKQLLTFLSIWLESSLTSPSGESGTILALGEPQVQVLAQVHDAILLQYREAEEEEILNAILPLMITPLTHKGRTMTIPSDIFSRMELGQALR